MVDDVTNRRTGTLTSDQVLALADETRAVVELSRRGIEEIWQLNGANDFVHLPLQLLAQGFERLLKLTYALAILKQDGQLPEQSVFRGPKGYGHNLVRLTDDLVTVVATQPAYTRRPAVQDDLTFIRADSDLRRVLHLLTTFGSRSRYYAFDLFIDPNSVDTDGDPDREWDLIVADVIRRQPDGAELMTDPSLRHDRHLRVAEHLTGILERFARAITRMWTLGALHDEARRYVGLVNEFLFLRDHDLGSSPLRRRPRQARDHR